MKVKLLFLTAALFFISSCSVLEPNTKTKAGTNFITLKFVQINDVYEIAPLNGGQYGGMARVAHIRDSIKNIFPNTYLFMAGDFLNPSLFGTIKVNGTRLYGKQMVEVMNAMNFDLVTFGNHEFDLDEEDLQKRLNESNFNWTSANVRHVTKRDTLPFFINDGSLKKQVSDYATFQVKENGATMKFGIVSVTLPSNPKDYVHYGDIFKDASRAYKLAENTTDVVFGLTHVSIDEDKKIAKLIPNMPLIMGGHEHNAMRVTSGNSVIAKADANAKSVYVHTIVFNPITKKSKIQSQLIFIDDTTQSNPEVAIVVEKWTAVLDEKLMEVIDDPNGIIYSPGTPLDGTDSANRSIQTNLGDIITQSMAYSYQYKVDAALVNGGSIRVDDMLSGSIAAKDIFRVLPFGGGVLKVDLTGKLLKKVLDYGKEKRGSGAYLQRYNIAVSPNGEWLVNGENISGEKMYSVAFSDYLLKGLDIPFLTPENKDVLHVYTPSPSETASDIRKAIVFYLKSLPK